MNNNHDQELFVGALVDFVDKNKHKGMQTVFQAERIGKQLGKDVGNALIENIFDSINRNELKEKLTNIYKRNKTNLSHRDLFKRNGVLFLSEESLSDQSKETVTEDPKDELPNNPSVLDPDNPQPGNIYHIDGPLGVFLKGGSMGHTATEVIPFPDGTRRVMSSTAGRGPYESSLDVELNGKTFEVTKPPKPVNKMKMEQKSQQLLGKGYDYGQFIKLNDPNKFTCTETSCEVSKAGGNEINIEQTGRTLDPNEVYIEAVRQGHKVIHWQNTPYTPKTLNNTLKGKNYRDSIAIYNPYTYRE